MKDDKIVIKNENIANYVMFKLDKIENSFTKEELNKITELIIDNNDNFENDYSILKELTNFKMVTDLTIRNRFILNKDFDIFLEHKKLNSFTFDNCSFENADLLTSLKVENLYLFNCKINNYKIIKDMSYLKQLSVVNGNIHISDINKLNKLNYLQLSYSNIMDINNYIKLESLEELYIDNTNIIKLSFVKDLKNLKRLSIDEVQYKCNKELIQSLIDKGIIVLNENIAEFEGEDDGK